MSKKPSSEEIIADLRKQLERHERFIRGIEPYLAQDGYHGFVENIQELLQYESGE